MIDWRRFTVGACRDLWLQSSATDQKYEKSVLNKSKQYDEMYVIHNMSLLVCIRVIGKTFGSGVLRQHLLLSYRAKPKEAASSTFSTLGLFLHSEMYLNPALIRQIRSRKNMY